MKKSPVRYLLFTVVSFYLLNISQSFAYSQAGLPTSICSGKNYHCDLETKKRWVLFKSADGLNTGSENFLTIGACSMNGQSDSDIYVLLALVHQIDDIYFDAKISFHNDLSNYQDTPVSELQTIFPQITFSQNLMKVSDSHAYIDYSRAAPFRYWVRHNRVENKLMMVAYFGYTITFLCEFEPL